MTRRHAFIAIAVVVVAAALIGVWTLRAPFLAAAEADMRTRSIAVFRVTGTRIPCDGLFDVGVTVFYAQSNEDKKYAGRLCRPLDRSSAWTWHPDPALGGK